MIKRKLNILPDNTEETPRGRFPSWLHTKLPKGSDLFQTGDIIQKYGLNTVCEEAKCPNRLECYSKKTATFLALGKECTRNCGFCDIDFSKNPQPLDPEEPEKIARSVQELGLKHVVITMVARDDLEDKGALQIARIIRKIRELNPQATIEVLTSDFSGQEMSLDIVLNENLDVFNHNLETIRRLTPRIRHSATYDRTLNVLKYVKESGKVPLVKSGIMVGLGESEEEVFETMHDLRNIGTDIMTIGQYLQASRIKLRVKEFVTPEQFKKYEEYGLSIGFQNVFSGPFVRSSYHAGEFVLQKNS